MFGVHLSKHDVIQNSAFYIMSHSHSHDAIPISRIQQLSNSAGISSTSTYHLYSSRDVLRNFWLMTIMFITL